MKVATILFTYNRPSHTQRTLDGLRNNHTIPQKLFIFHDGKKPTTNVDDWKQVERIVHAVDWCDCDVITSECNKGLANSVIDGVNYAFDSYDAVVVLEDDCVTHPIFMDYMIEALNKYKNEKNVYSIGAWAEPVDVPPNGTDAFFVGRINSVGWATWKTKWQFFRRDYDLIKEIKSDPEISEWLDIWGQDLEETLHKNMCGKVDTWAAFWALSVIRQKGLSISPYYSLVENIGFDGTGRHSGNASVEQKLMPIDKENILLPNYIAPPENFKSIFEYYYSIKKPVMVEKYYKETLLQWVDLLRKGRCLSDWFNEKGVNTISLWGLGDVGKRLIDDVSNQIEIRCIIETNPNDKEYKGIKIGTIHELENDISDCDLIVLIPGYDTKRISKNFDDHLVKKIIAVDELFRACNLE